MNTKVAKTEERSLSMQLKERDITLPQWHTLSKSLYPGAAPASVLMVIDYCRARGLDPLKKPAHIVPMYVEDKVTGQKGMRDVILPGIYELRTTAHRTGEYLGHSKPMYGEEIDFRGVKAPAWCEMTIYRWNHSSHQRTEFPVRVLFAEAVGVNKEGKPNQRWTKAPAQMLTKCTEAAGLREAFPDHLGGQLSAEEVDGDQSSVVWTESPKSTSLADIIERANEPGELEVEVMIDDEDGTVVINLADVEKMIENAKTAEGVTEAMDLIRELPDVTERNTLKKKALAKLKEVSK